MIYALGNHKANGKPLLKTIPDLGRREIDAPADKRITARDDLGGTTPVQHREIDQILKFLDLVPLGEILQIICPDEINETNSWIITQQLPDRIDGVGGAGAMKFPLIHGKAILACDCLPQHEKSLIIGGRGRSIRLEWRDCRRDEDNPIQPQLLQGSLRKDQVSQMHRIETSSEQADPFDMTGNAFRRHGLVQLQLQLKLLIKQVWLPLGAEAGKEWLPGGDDLLRTPRGKLAADRVIAIDLLEEIDL